jgi:hypothetical protein
MPLIFAAQDLLTRCCLCWPPVSTEYFFWLSSACEAGLLGHAAIFAYSGLFSKISFSSSSIFLGLSPQENAGSTLILS